MQSNFDRIEAVFCIVSRQDISDEAWAGLGSPDKRCGGSKNKCRLMPGIAFWGSCHEECT